MLGGKFTENVPQTFNCLLQTYSLPIEHFVVQYIHIVFSNSLSQPDMTVRSQRKFLTTRHRQGGTLKGFGATGPTYF